MPDHGEIRHSTASVEQRVDAIQAAIDDTFEGGNYFGTLENEGVALAPFHDYEDDLPDLM